VVTLFINKKPFFISLNKVISKEGTEVYFASATASYCAQLKFDATFRLSSGLL